MWNKNKEKQSYGGRNMLEKAIREGLSSACEECLALGELCEQCEEDARKKEVIV